MTTDLEKQFFSTFGVEPKPLFSTRNGYTDDQYIYPIITERILLELICIVNKHLDEGFWAENMTDLKEEALQNCLLAVNTTDYGVAGYEEEVKQQVQALFKE